MRLGVEEEDGTPQVWDAGADGLNHLDRGLLRQIKRHQMRDVEGGGRNVLDASCGVRAEDDEAGRKPDVTQAFLDRRHQAFDEPELSWRWLAEKGGNAPHYRILREHVDKTIHVL